MVQSWIKPIVVIALFLAGVYGSVLLASHMKLSEPSFMIFIAISGIFAFLLPNISQLKSFSISKGELILQEMKDSEAAVKELALATVNLVEVSSQHAIVTEEYSQEEYEVAVEKVRNLAGKT